MSRRAARLLLAASFGGALIGCGRGTPAQPAARPNILLVTIDTFRADRIGVGVAPVIDRLATEGLRFTAARTAAPLTLPSHTTIHTGLLPPQHGVRENGAGALGESHRTVARLLKDAGYRTAAFVGAFVLDRRFGLAQGFDVYDDHIPRDPNATERLEAERPASAVIDDALAWFGDGGRTNLRATSPPNPQSPIPNPFFVWIHLYDPHAPYTPPPEFAARARTPYDGEITYADAQLGRLLDALRGRGDLEKTLVVVAGDHGEGLGDHGERTHGMLLYESTLRVPLVIVAAGAHPQTIDAPVSLAEIAPTILHAAGVTPPPEMRGRNLVTVRLKPDTTVDRGPDLYSETEYPRVAGWSPLQALTDGRWKTIRAGSASEVYDLQQDPGEAHDLAATQGGVATAMAARADAIHAAAVDSARTISPDAQERLRALGYVASTAAPPSGAAAVNPRTTTAAWTAFEDALAALNAHRPSAVDGLKALAAGEPLSQDDKGFIIAAAEGRYRLCDDFVRARRIKPGFQIAGQNMMNASRAWMGIQPFGNFG